MICKEWLLNSWRKLWNQFWWQGILIFNPHKICNINFASWAAKHKIISLSLFQEFANYYTRSHWLFTSQIFFWDRVSLYSNISLASSKLSVILLSHFNILHKPYHTYLLAADFLTLRFINVEFHIHTQMQFALINLKIMSAFVIVMVWV